MATSRKRKTRRKRNSKKGSWFGNLLLELVAIGALLFALSMSNPSERQNDDRGLSYRSAGIGAAINAFVEDQLGYQQGF